MNENNIIELLPIYDEALYITSQNKSTFDAKLDKPKADVLVLLAKGDLNDETNILLDKMLAASKFSKEDYQIVSVLQSSVFDAINHHQSATILLFGLSLSSEVFNAQKEKYKPFRFGGKKILLCDSLVTIATNPTLKSTLWTNGLKVLFNITP